MTTAFDRTKSGKQIITKHRTGEISLCGGNTIFCEEAGVGEISLWFQGKYHYCTTVQYQGKISLLVLVPGGKYNFLFWCQGENITSAPQSSARGKYFSYPVRCCEGKIGPKAGITPTFMFPKTSKYHLHKITLLFKV